MKVVPCPSCGAEVQFESAASCMAVCSYCRTTLVRSDDGIRNVGKMAEAIEDYSPIQIGSTGIYDGVAFFVVGRAQVRYDEGFWNEWYLVFSDGRTGWLGDFSGQYSLSFQVEDFELPAERRFEDLKPGAKVNFRGTPLEVSDARVARLEAGQGELPFIVGAGQDMKAVDMRSADGDFWTLDFSFGRPVAYRGRSVTLQEIQAAHLRDAREMQAAELKLHGQTQAIVCASCGAALKPVLKQSYVVCSKCGHTTDLTLEVPTLIDSPAFSGQALIEPRIALGKQGVLDGVSYTVIGFQRRRAKDGSLWDEYLLHGTKDGFLYLVDANHEWAKAVVLDRPPVEVSSIDVCIKNECFQQTEQYSAETVYAAGEFTWKLTKGYTVSVVEYKGPNRRLLAKEISDTDVSWSLNTPVLQGKLETAFGVRQVIRKPSDASESGALSMEGLPSTIVVYTFWINVAVAILALDGFAMFIHILLCFGLALLTGVNLNQLLSASDSGGTD